STLLWASVAPAQLGEVASALAQHEELAFVATTTGPTNLVALIHCRKPSDLNNYLIKRISTLHAISALETAPILKTFKGSSPTLMGDPSRRLAKVI
ncbi:MAG: Lrp/AsnC ligand binding domain-containing protein, partial [Actinobacteria bacterium]|nr:Lrp/AsnC ligand binding domain-containing protein [Actinomycetota bacterium]